MAVRLLAGPFKIMEFETKRIPNQMELEAYLPGVGIIAYGHYPVGTTTESQAYHRMALDGQTVPHPYNRVVAYSWWPERQRLVYKGISNVEMVFEPKVFVMQHVLPPGTPAVHVPGSRYVKFPDKWIYHKGFRIGAVLLSGEQVDEGPPWLFHCLFVIGGRNNDEVFGVGTGNDRGQFYNVYTQEFTSPILYLGMPAQSLLFATDWHVLISCHEDEAFPEGPAHAIRIWSLEVDPQILTDPEPYIGTPKSGQVVTYRVQLTGAQNDPAEGELIDWSVTGAGTLLDPQSKTDADGYALARVQYQIGETGDSLVEASVQC